MASIPLYSAVRRSKLKDDRKPSRTEEVGADLGGSRGAMGGAKVTKAHGLKFSTSSSQCCVFTTQPLPDSVSQGLIWTLSLNVISEL